MLQLNFAPRRDRLNNEEINTLLTVIKNNHIFIYEYFTHLVQEEQCGDPNNPYFKALQ